MYRVVKVKANLQVPSTEKTVERYRRVLGWDGHYDAFDSEDRCLFGSVFRNNSADALKGFNLKRAKDPSLRGTSSYRAFVNVGDVEEVYRRMQESEWPIEKASRERPWGGGPSQSGI